MSIVTNIILPIMIIIIGYLCAFKTGKILLVRAKLIGKCIDPNNRYDYWLSKIGGYIMFLAGIALLLAGINKIG